MRIALIVCSLVLLMRPTLIAADESTPTPADKALATMIARPGFEVELVAAEPLVMDPVGFAWGADGKLWVVEMADYPLGIDGKGKFGGRVRYLEDTDGDGKYDRSTVFLDGLGYPNGVMPWRRGVLVTCGAELFYAEDTDGDGKADLRQPLYVGFNEGNQQHRVCGLRWGLDNWIHCGNGDSGGTIEVRETGQKVNISGRDFRIRPDQHLIDPQTGVTQFLRVCDDWGNWFGSKNSQPLLQYVLPDEYLRRNPHLPAVQTWVEVPSVPGAAPVYPASRTVARFNDLNKSNRFTSACGEEIYRDELFGPEFVGNSFVCEPVHNLVHREVLTPSGVTFTSHRAADERKSEFLASTDNWSRPVMVRTGPDGALWVADMYRLVIEHPEWIPKDWQARIDVRAGHDKGRIYRVFPKGVRPRPIPQLDGLDALGLVAALDSPSGCWRDMAQMLLVQRKDSAAVEPLKQLVRSSQRPQTRLQALCTLDGLGALDAGILTIAINDKHPGVRRHAVRLSEPLFDTSAPLADAVERLARDTDAPLRLQVACSLGAWHDRRAGLALGTITLQSMGDPFSAINDSFMTAAVLSSVNEKNIESVVSVAMLGDVAGRPPPAALVEKLVLLAIACQSDLALEWVLVAIGNAGGDALWQRESLRGLLDALDRRNLSLAKFRDKASPKLKGAIDRLALVFDVARVTALGGPDETARATAVAILGRGLEGRDADMQLLAGLFTPQTPAKVQASVIAAIARLGDRRGPEVLLSAWKGLGPDLRGQVLDALLGRTAWTLVLLDKIGSREVLPGEIDAARAQRLLEHKEAEIRGRAAKLLAASTNPDRQKAVEQYRVSLTLTGDAARGLETFKKRCSSCHKLGDLGHAVGADLTALTDKSPGSMLVAILDPNKAVEAKFINYTAVTTAGLTYNGMLAAETSTSVTLLAAEGKEIPLLRSELEELVSTSKSLMPEGLEKDLQPQDLADLFALLSRATGQRKKFAGNHPVVVEPEALRGEFYLLPEQAEIYGSTLVLEDRYDNLGFWQSGDDYAAWSIDVRQPGKYDVWLEYASSDETAGNSYVLSVDDHRLARQVIGTGGWDNYRQVVAGQIILDAGTRRLVVRPDGKLHGPLFDLKSIRMKPIKQSPAR